MSAIFFFFQMRIAKYFTLKSAKIIDDHLNFIFADVCHPDFHLKELARSIFKAEKYNLTHPLGKMF